MIFLKEIKDLSRSIVFIVIFQRITLQNLEVIGIIRIFASDKEFEYRTYS